MCQWIIFKGAFPLKFSSDRDLASWRSNIKFSEKVWDIKLILRLSLYRKGYLVLRKLSRVESIRVKCLILNQNLRGKFRPRRSRNGGSTCDWNLTLAIAVVVPAELDRVYVGSDMFLMIGKRPSILEDLAYEVLICSVVL